MGSRNEEARNKSFKMGRTTSTGKNYKWQKVLEKARAFGAHSVNSASVYAGPGFPPTFELAQAAGSSLFPWGKGYLPAASDPIIMDPPRAGSSVLAVRSVNPGSYPKVFFGVFM